MEKKKNSATRPISITREERPSRYVLILIFLLSVAAYANTLPNHLVYDDLILIPNNPTLQNPWNLADTFTKPYWGEIRSGAAYRPFSSWTIALNCRINEVFGVPGETPSGYHLLNTFLHALASCVLYLYLLSLSLSSRISAIAALIFSVHPIHTEAVAAIIGRAEIWAFLFGMIMLILHRRRQYPLPGAIAYFLALLSKESALMFFPLALVADALFPDRHRRWPWTRYGLYTLAGAAWFTLWWSVHDGHIVPFPFIDNPLVAVSFLQRFYTAASIQLDYLFLLVYPLYLSSDYSYNQIPVVLTFWNAKVAVFLLLAILALWTGWKLRKTQPGVLFGVAGYALLFGVAGNFIQPIGVIMGERLAYAPSFGVCLIPALAIGYLDGRIPGTLTNGLIGILLIIGLGITAARNATWKDEKAFFSAQVEYAPRSAKAHYNLGTALAKEGDDSSAIREYETALAIFPIYPEPLYNMGNALRRINAEPDRVIAAYRGAIEYDRGHAHARANLASYLLDLGRIEEARPLVEELGRLDSAYPSLDFLNARIRQTPAAMPPLFQQGVMAYADGNHQRAIELLDTSVRTESLPDAIRRTALMALSNACLAAGDTVRAGKYRAAAEQITLP